MSAFVRMATASCLVFCGIAASGRAQAACSQPPGGALTLAAGSLSINSDACYDSVSVTGGLLSVNGATLTASAPATVTGAQIANSAPGTTGTLALAGGTLGNMLINSAGTGKITVANSGALTISGPVNADYTNFVNGSATNTGATLTLSGLGLGGEYVGADQVTNYGTVIATGGANTLGAAFMQQSSGKLQVADGGVLSLTAGGSASNNSVSLSNGAGLTFGGGDFALTGTGTLGGASNTVTVTYGTLTQAGSFGGKVVSAGGTTTVAGAIAGDLTVSGGAITPSGAIGGDAVVSGGTLTLGTANQLNAAGTLKQTGGTVAVNADQTVANLNATGGTLSLNGTTLSASAPATINGATIANAAAGTTGTLALAGGTLANTLINSAGTGKITVANSAALTLSGPVSADYTNFVNGSASNSTATLTLSGLGLGGEYVGADQVTNYGTVISAGPANTLGAAFAQQSTGKLQVADGGVLSLTAGGSASNNSVSLSNGAGLTFGGGDFALTGTGTLGGASNTVTVTYGTVTQAGSFGGNVVAAGGTTTVAGTIAGDLTVSGGAITPAGAIGGNATVSAGTLTLNTANQLSATGTLKQSGGTIAVNADQTTANLNLTGGVLSLNGTTLTASAPATINGATIANAAAGTTGTLALAGGTLANTLINSAGTGKITVANSAALTLSGPVNADYTNFVNGSASNSTATLTLSGLGLGGEYVGADQVTNYGTILSTGVTNALGAAVTNHGLIELVAGNTLGVGDFTQGTDGRLLTHLGSNQTAGLLHITGTADWDWRFGGVIDPGTVFGASDVFEVVHSDNLIGAFTPMDLTIDGVLFHEILVDAGHTIDLVFGGIDLPEPAAPFGATLAGLLLARGTKRRR